MLITNIGEIYILLVGTKVMAHRKHYLVESLYFRMDEWMNEFEWISRMVCSNNIFLLAKTLQSVSKNRNVCIFVISDYHTFTSKNFRVLGLLREKSEFFIPLEIQIELDFHHTNTIIKLLSFKALKWYLNDKIWPMVEEHPQFKRVTAQIFQLYYSIIFFLLWNISNYIIYGGDFVLGWVQSSGGRSLGKFSPVLFGCVDCSEILLCLKLYK